MNTTKPAEPEGRRSESPPPLVATHDEWSDEVSAQSGGSDDAVRDEEYGVRDVEEGGSYQLPSNIQASMPSRQQDADPRLQHSTTDMAAVVAAATAAALSAMTASTASTASISASSHGETPGTSPSSSAREGSRKRPPRQIDTTSAVTFDIPKQQQSRSVESPTSVATGSTTMASPTPTVATVEHRHVSQTRNKSTTSMCAGMMKKPVLMLIAYALLATGAGVFLLNEFFSIPSLNDQIGELTAQVDRLEAEVDRLGGEVDELTVQVDRLGVEVNNLRIENDRIEVLNKELAANNANYTALNDELQANNDRFDALNDQLNASNVEFARLNGELELAIFNLSDSNDNLNGTTLRLLAAVEELQGVNQNLTATVREYAQVTEVLSGEVDELDRISASLNETVQSLNGEIGELKGENDRLRDFNDDLTEVVSFLNETASGYERTFQGIAKILSDQIASGRSTAVGTLKVTLMQKATNWDCGLRTKFSVRDFSKDDNLPIGADDYSDVLGYVDNRVLKELCIDTDDFESYLASEIVKSAVPPVNVTVNGFEKAVSRYSTLLWDFYFPDAGDEAPEGINSTEWADAKYACAGLPTNRRFRFAGS